MKNEELEQLEVMEQTAKLVSLGELPSTATAPGPKIFDGNFAIIAGVKVNVEVVVGAAEISVNDLYALQKESVLTLNQLHDAPLTVRLDGKNIALGTLVVVGENFGVRITDILDSSIESK